MSGDSYFMRRILGRCVAIFAFVAIAITTVSARAAEDEGDPVTEPAARPEFGALPFRDVLFSPDDKLIATTAGKEGNLREFSVWNAGSWDKRFSYQALRTQRTLHFSADNKRLTIGIIDGKLTALDAASGEIAVAVANPDQQSDKIELSPGGKMLAIANRKDFNISLWDGEKLESRGVLKGHKKYISGMAFSPDGNYLLTCGSDHEAILWNTAKAEKVRSLGTGNRSANCVTFSPDGKYLAIGCNDADIRVYATASGARFTKFSMPGRSAPQRLAFTRDSKFLAVAGSTPNVVIFHMSKSAVKPEELQTVNQLIAQLDDDQFAVRDRAMKELARLGTAVAPALNTALNNAPSDEVRRRLRSILASLQPPKPHAVLAGHRAQVDALAFSHDGKLLATASLDTTVRIWDTSTGQTVATLGAEQE